jgi:hypothetical protein
MDRFSIRTTVLLGVSFLAVGIGLCFALHVIGKAGSPPVSYECHFPTVTCARVSDR